METLVCQDNASVGHGWFSENASDFSRFQSIFESRNIVELDDASGDIRIHWRPNISQLKYKKSVKHLFVAIEENGSNFYVLWERFCRLGD
jgi:hypothetical protein